MPTNTTLTVVSGRTVLLFASGKAPTTLLVGGRDDLDQRLAKLAKLDALYDRWVASAYDDRKSPAFSSGYPYGFLDGYTGSLFFVEDEDDYQIALAHVFEDHFDEEYSADTHSYQRRARRTGIEAARDFARTRFEGKGGIKEHLESLGLTDCRAWYVRYKNGRTYP